MNIPGDSVAGTCGATGQVHTQATAVRDIAEKRGNAQIPKILSFNAPVHCRLEGLGREAVMVGTEAAEVMRRYQRRNDIQFTELLMIANVQREIQGGN
jgi:hypothetical protein